MLRLAREADRESAQAVQLKPHRTVRQHHCDHRFSNSLYGRHFLDADQVEWLGRLSVSLEPFPVIMAFHARPDDDDAFLLEEVGRDRLLAPPSKAVAARLGAATASLVL